MVEKKEGDIFFHIVEGRHGFDPFVIIVNGHDDVIVSITREVGCMS